MLRRYMPRTYAVPYRVKCFSNVRQAAFGEGSFCVKEVSRCQGRPLPCIELSVRWVGRQGPLPSGEASLTVAGWRGGMGAFFHPLRGKVLLSPKILVVEAISDGLLVQLQT